jgi:hypothetical protein
LQLLAEHLQLFDRPSTDGKIRLAEVVAAFQDPQGKQSRLSIHGLTAETRKCLARTGTVQLVIHSAKAITLPEEDVNETLSAARGHP